MKKIIVEYLLYFLVGFSGAAVFFTVFVLWALSY